MLSLDLKSFEISDLGGSLKKNIYIYISSSMYQKVKQV